MMLRCIVLICSVFLANPSIAQDGSESSMPRTPENARKFLELLPDKTFLVLASVNSEKRSQISYIVKSIRHVDNCKFVIDGVPRLYGFFGDGMVKQKGQAVDMERGDPTLFANIGSSIQAAGLRNAPFELSWGAVSIFDASKNGNAAEAINVRLVVPNGQINLQFLTNEWVSRTGLAISTLIRSCDGSGETGF